MNDMMKRLLSFTLALVMVFGMMPAEALASELDNTEPTVTPTEAPTEVVTEAPATEHSHAHEGAVTTAATCEAEGVMTYTCSCGDTYTKEIAALGHTYVDGFCACGAEDPDWTPADGGTDGDVPEETTEAPAHTHAHEGAVTTEATCTEDGVKTFTCSCGDSYTEAIAATGHAYEDGVCGVCGAADPDYEEKPELSGETRKIYYYNVESWDEVWAAWSFDEDGFDDVAHPGEELSSNTELEDVYVIKVPVEADEVLFSDGIEVTEELLEQERLAGVSVTHEIEVRLAEDRYYDLYQNGAWANYAQTVKALEETEPETEAPAEHTCSYEGTVTKEATCEEAGEMIYACTCGESNTEVMPALGHDYAEGKCTRCGAADPVAEVQAMIEALPTSFATQAEVDNFWDVTAAELDAAIEALTAEQQEQLDTARYDAAIDAAAAFANPEFNDWTSWAASNPTWDATATNPYIIHVGYGEADDITKGQLWDLLNDLAFEHSWSVTNGSTGLKGGFKYGNSQLTSIANTTNRNDAAGLSKDTVYEIQYCIKIGSWTQGFPETWKTAGSFKVVEESETINVRVTNNNFVVDYFEGVSATEQWESVHDQILAGVGAIKTVGAISGTETSVTSGAVVKFHHKTDGLYGVGATDEYLELNAANASKFDETKDQNTFEICYGTATPASITVTLVDPRTPSNIQVKSGATAQYYTQMDEQQTKESLFNAIYNAGASTPNNLTVNDVTVEVQVYGDWWTDVTGEVAGYKAIDLLKNFGTSVNTRIVFAGNDTYTGDTSDGVAVTLEDNRKEVSIAKTEVTVSYQSATILEDMIAAIGANYNGVSYEHSTGIISDADVTAEALREAAAKSKDNTLEVTVKLGQGDEEYKPFEEEVTVSFDDAWYTVTWYKEDGETAIDTTDALFGTAPTHADASKDATAQYTYTFAGWAPVSGVENGVITGNAAYKATYTETVNKYLVEFVNEDNTVLQSSEWEYGATPEYIGETPEKTADAQYTYTFDAWDKEIVPVTGSVTYTATYSTTTNEYKIIFKSHDGEEELSVAYGVVPTDHDGYVEPEDYAEGDTHFAFAGWDANGDDKVDTVTTVTGDATYVAVYTNAQIFKVTFDANGGKLTEHNVKRVVDGDKVAALEVSYEGYRFDGWYLTGEDGELKEKPFDFEKTAINADITLTAKWQKTYTATYVTEYGTAPEAVTKDEGTVITIAGLLSGEENDNRVMVGWFIGEEKVEGEYTLSADVDIVAKWAQDVNNNEIPDENETVTIVVKKTNDADKVMIGETELAAGENDYIFDSTSPVVTITATPVVNDGISTTYVKSIGAKGATELSYADFVAAETVQVNNGDVIEVVFEAVPVMKDPADVVEYNFFTREIPYEDIYNSVITTPQIISENTKVEYTYFARPAMKHTVTIDALNLDSSIKALLNTIGVKEFSFDMDELWLPLNAEIEDSVDLQTAVSTYLTKDRIYGLLDIYNAAHDKAYDDYIAANGNSFLDRLAAEAAALAAGGAAAWADIEDIYEVVYASAMYYGAHEFGYNADGAETVNEQIKIAYSDPSMYWESEAIVILKDSREISYITGSDLTLTYRDYLDEDILTNFTLTDQDGNPIEGEIYSVELTDPYTYEGKNVSETAYELTVKFAGNENYRRAEKKVFVTVVKAGLSIDLPNLNITHGDAYDIYANVTTQNAYGLKQEVIDSLVEIIIGLDVADLEVTKEGDVSGVGARVQIMLPKDEAMATIFKTLGVDIYSEEGETVDLAGLQEILGKLDGVLDGFDSSNGITSGINSVLQSITGLVDLSNVEITFGGKYPTDVGVYLYGAVSTSGNYKTAYDVAYMIIKPETIKAELAWNYVDENYIFSHELLQYVDLGAHIVNAEQYNNQNLEVLTFFFGADENGKFVTAWDGEELGNGAYAEFAFMIEFGNEFYYAAPLARPVLIIPNVVDVQIQIGGEVKDEYLLTFDGAPVDAELIFKTGLDLTGKSVEKSIEFYGIQTNTKTYESNEAPTHAGAYVATATVIIRDEAGELLAVGLDIAPLVIEPAESTITVEDKIVAWDGTHYVFADQVTATSPAGVNPDKTIISAGINTDGDFSENGWAAVGGTVNVDFPRWIDELIAQYAPSVVEGISVKEFSDKLVSKLPSIAAKLEELGATNEMLHSLTNAVTSVAGALENIPENVKLSFKDDAYASSVGAYVIIGIVTDSDHIPSVDAGLLVIAPDVNPVELKWNYEDEDNIWTRELLKFVDLKATAYSAVTGERNEAATDMITHKFIGIDKKGNLIVKDTRNADELPNGAYFELAYIKLDVDGAMTVSNLIAREILLVPGTVEVAFVDAPENNIWNHTFDNTPKAVEVVVTNNGKVVEPKAGELTVTYTGIQTNGKIYRSTEAPVHAGAYTVAAEYVEYTAGGSLANIGAAAGFITIAPAEATINVADSMIVDFQSGKSYDLEETMVTVGSAVPNLKPDTTIISAQINTDGDFSENGWAAVNGNVNVDFPRWMDELLAEQVPGVKDGITAAELKEKLTAKLPGILSKLEDLGATNEIINSLNNLVGNLNKVLAQIPDNMTLTFKDDVVVSSVGAYAVAAIVTDSDHIPAADAGILVILPDVDVVDLKWNHEDANNIWTRELLEEFDLWAKAYDKESGELDAGATAVIHYQFIGMDKNGNLLVIDTNDANDLPNGVYTELAYIELEIDGHMYISDMIARTVIIVPNAAEVKFVDVNGNNARRFVFDNTQKTMDVTVALNGEVINPAEGTLTFTYNGIQTNGKTYNSTTAPVHAGVYTVMAEYADYTEGGSLAHYGAAAGIMAIEPAASTMDVTGGTVTYDGEGHTATVVATGSGVTEPDYTLISGGAYVSGDINEVGVDAFHGNVNIDFPAWLDKTLAEHEFKTEGVDTAYLTDFISSYRDDALALIPVEALVKLGVAEEEINAYIAKLNGYIDELLAVLEKLPAGVALTFNDDATYTEPGYYFFYGIVTDSDHYPSADTGLLVIEKKEILFDLLDTKVTWNGKGQMVDLNNPENADFVTVVIDRKNNTINIVLDEDAQYALNAVAKLLGVEFDGDVQMSTILDKYNGKEVAAAIVKLIDEAQKLNLSEEIQKVLAAVKAELETLPTSGTITVNGELPTELGVYEVYAISYSQHFKTTAAEAELEIVPVRVEVILNEVSKVYGEEDPELTYTVKYYDHEGNEMTGVDANITVQISREAGEDVGTYAITGTVTLGDNTHFELIKQPVDSKFTITKATDNTWTEEPGIEGWTYGETAKTPVGEAKYGEIKVEYRPADDPDAPFTTTVPTDAGDYIVRFTVEGTDNYNGITVEKELTIAKAASKITEEPKAVENLVYDGENHALITAGVAEGGKLVYSLSENGPFSEEIPVGKEAGTYTVYYKVAGDNNHNDSEVKSITVKIKEDHTGEYPIDMSAFADHDTIKPGATVEIDGVPYTLDEDCIAWAKNTDAKIVTTYKYHEGNTANETYPTNMYVWYLTTEDTDKDQKMDKYNAERIPELDNLFEYNGTSIRVGAAKNGIRFFTSMNPSTRTALQNGTLINTSVLKGAKMVCAGTVFKKNPEVQVTLENGVSSDVYGGKAGSNFRVFGTYSGRNWFTGMLVGLDTDAETVTAGIAARPYAQLQIGDETVVIYGGQIQRSIYYVACQNQDTFAQGSSYDQFVEGLIAKGNSIRGEG